TPYSAISQAFANLVRQLLAGSPQQVEAWRTKIAQTLGSNGQVIVEIIPLLELLIGRQAPVPPLPPAEAQNRLNIVFQDFLSVIATADHPLAIFLDDLQWADIPSLKLIETLVTSPKSKYFLLISAYRDNEVDATHVAMSTIGEIRKRGAAVTEVDLLPLELKDVSALIADTLRQTDETVRPLAVLLHTKTGGNPFFLVQVLRELYDEGMLLLDSKTGVWSWSLPRIQKISISDNVVELMTKKLNRLSHDTVSALKLAACIGNNFDLNVLSVVLEQAPQKVAASLWQAVNEGVVVPRSETYKYVHVQREVAKGEDDASAARELVNTLMAREASAGKLEVRYRFLHDRVQQAAYQLIPEAERAALHLKIGRLLLKHSPVAPEQQHADQLFSTVGHLNQGADLLTAPEEKLELAKLNFLAGGRAKSATAYNAAAAHYAKGMQLLPATAWKEHYRLTYDLHMQGAECEYLIGKQASSEKLLRDASAHAQSTLDRLEPILAQMRAQLSGGINGFDKALALAKEAFSLLGHDLPDTAEKWGAAVAAEAKLIEELLAKRDVKTLIELPALTDPEVLAMQRLAAQLFGIGYFMGNELVAYSVYLILRLSLQRGNSDVSAFAYSMYGVIAGSGGDYQRALQFGELSLKVNERYPNVEVLVKISNLWGLSISPYVNHLEANLPHFQVTYQNCLQAGELAYGIFAVYFTICTRFMKGDALEQVLSGSEQYRAFVRQTNDVAINLAIEMLRQTMRALQGKTKAPGSLDGDDYNDEKVQAGFEEAKFLSGLFWQAILRGQLYFTLDRYEEALASFRRADPLFVTNMAFFNGTNHHFYYTLALAASYPTMAEPERADALKLMQRNIEQIGKWAQSAPVNYQHRHELARAELARLQKDDAQASTLYEKAVRHAREGRFQQDEALAFELAAKHSLAQEREQLARFYMTEAHYAYTRWGAKAKVAQLEQRFPELLASQRELPPSNEHLVGRTVTRTVGTVHGVGSGLDLATMVKASQTLSGEIVLKRLLHELIKLVLANAGAQRAWLLLHGQDGLAVEATGSVDGEVTVLASTPLEKAEGIARGIVRYVERTRESVVLADAARKGDFISDSDVVRLQPKSVLCVPVIHAGKTLGAMYLENNLTSNAFTPARIELLQILSTQAAISIENGQLYASLEAKVEQRTRELREKDNSLIAAVQSFFLPSQTRHQSKACELSGLYLPAEVCSGDWWWYEHDKENDRTWVWLGDVTGHGPPSAMLTASIASFFRCLRRHAAEVEPHEVLAALHEELQTIARGEYLMTMSAMVFEPGRVRWWNAGAPQLLVVGPSGAREVLTAPSFPLGVKGQLKLGSVERKLAPGDRVLAFTDGLVELEDTAGRALGVRRLVEMLSGTKGLSVAAAVDQLKAGIQAVAAGRSLQDDITLAIVDAK
ncbi:MAG: SpoIIE family protein phosphatase, partial [Myxococcaceae bacterium]